MRRVNAKLLIVCAGTGIFLLPYFLVCEPEAEHLRVMSRDIKQKSREMREENRLQQEFRSLQEEKARLQNTLVAFRHILPGQEDVRSFIRDVWENAEREGVTIDSLQPGQITKGDRFSWVPLKLAMRGDFGKLYAFIHRIESLPRLIRVAKMRMASMSQNAGYAASQGDSGGVLPLQADLELHAYVSSDDKGSALLAVPVPEERTDTPDYPAAQDSHGECVLPKDPFQEDVPVTVTREEGKKGEEVSSLQSLPQFRLEGIMVDGSVPRALIDGRVYGPGEKVGDASIKEICGTKVVFVQENREFIVYLHEEEK